MRFILTLLSRTPLALLYVWSWLIFVGAFHVARWRREQVERDVDISFADRTPDERAAIVKASYRHAADMLVEMFWGFAASAEALKARVVFENPEIVQRYVDAARSVVLLAPHYGNWEWLFLAGGARFGIPIDTVYQPHRLPSVEKFLLEARTRFGGAAIPRADFVFEMMRRADTPHAYSLIADQTPRPDERKHWTKFLGRDTAFYVGADHIARFLDAAVLYVAMRRVARGRYSVRLEVLAEPPYANNRGEEIMERFARRAEAAVKESPAEFLWIQKRWKYPRPTDE